MLPEKDNFKPFSFKKNERITSKILLRNLIDKGTSLFLYPIKCYALLSPVNDGKFDNQIAIAVPKRIFKRAVDRNRVKRIIRETYRLNNKMILCPLSTDETKRVALLFVFIGKEMPDYRLIEKVMVDLLKKVSQLV
jgi:ribonuclease P protein component